MTDPNGDPDRDPPQTLHQLIRSRMEERGWTYADLERRSGNALTRGRCQQPAERSGFDASDAKPERSASKNASGN